MKKGLLFVCCLALLFSFGCAGLLPGGSWVDQTRTLLTSAMIAEGTGYVAVQTLCAEAILAEKDCTLASGLNKEFNDSLVEAIDALDKYDRNELTLAEVQAKVNKSILTIVRVKKLIEEYMETGSKAKAIKLRSANLFLPTGKEK